MSRLHGIVHLHERCRQFFAHLAGAFGQPTAGQLVDHDIAGGACGGVAVIGVAVLKKP